MVDPVHYRSAVALCAAIRRGEHTSEAVTRAFLERIEIVDGLVNAVVARDPEAALARAHEADRAHARGELWGPLHGLPLTVKDSFEAIGMPTTSGSERLADHVPERNATAVQRLVDAGAIVIGKTNLPFMAGDFQSYNAVYGTTHNPWDPGRTPGGSSGGSAAALAAGMTPVELGSDIGGSIRNPAHYCGVMGHKPSYGLVPLRGHIPGPPGTRSRADLAVAGPMARHVEDLALMLEILAGPDDRDSRAWSLSLPEPRAVDLRDFRIGVWLDDPRCPVDTEVAEAHRDLVAAIEAAGGNIVSRACPLTHPERARDTYLHLLYAAMAAGFPPSVTERCDARLEHLDGDDQTLEACMVRGVALRHRDWLRLNERREALRREWAAVFRDIDVLLCPIMPTVAFPHDHSPMEHRVVTVDGRPFPYFEQAFWPGLASAAYLPSTCVPCGRFASGLPVGIQITGPYLEDRTTLAFARIVESLVGGFRAPPGY